MHASQFVMLIGRRQQGHVDQNFPCRLAGLPPFFSAPFDNISALGTRIPFPPGDGDQVEALGIPGTLKSGKQHTCTQH